MKTCQPRVGRSVLSVLDTFCTKKDVLAALTVVTINASNPNNWPLLGIDHTETWALFIMVSYIALNCYPCVLHCRKQVVLLFAGLFSVKFTQISTNRSNCCDADMVALLMVLSPQS